MEQTDEMVWDIKGKPASQIASEFLQELYHLPTEVTLTITLTGTAAKRYTMAARLVGLSTGWSPEDVNAYLLRGGAVREMERLGTALGDIGREIK